MIQTVHGQQVGVSRLGDGSIRISAPAAVLTVHRGQALALAAAIREAATDAEAS